MYSNRNNDRGASGSFSLESARTIKGAFAKAMKIDEDLKKQNKAIIQEFSSRIIQAMSSNKLFSYLFQRTYFTGSSYEGLRISDPNEFDIDLVLNFEKVFKHFKRIVPVESRSGFTAYQLCSGWDVIDERDSSQIFLVAEIKRHLVEDSYLMPGKIRSWIQSIIDKINVQQISLRHVNVSSITITQSGPARTFILKAFHHNQQFYDISIDLVPVILMPFEEAPSYFDRSIVRKFNIENHNLFYFMVPKEYSGKPIYNTSVRAKRLWRLHFPGIEKTMIYNRGCVKPVIKLLKHLRDRQCWYCLSSYALKTVVMHKILEKTDESHWQESNMEKMFMECLERLLFYLAKKNIPHIFFPEDNLLQSVNDHNIENMYYRLKKIHRDLNENFDGMFNHYLPADS